MPTSVWVVTAVVVCTVVSAAGSVSGASAGAVVFVLSSMMTVPVSAELSFVSVDEAVSDAASDVASFSAAFALAVVSLAVSGVLLFSEFAAAEVGDWNCFSDVLLSPPLQPPRIKAARTAAAQKKTASHVPEVAFLYKREILFLFCSFISARSRRLHRACGRSACRAVSAAYLECPDGASL